MSIAVPIQTSFNGGKFSSRVMGRSDLAKYSFACEELQNFIPTVQGPVVKRSGTRYVKQAISDAAESRLIPFSVSADQSYVVELTQGSMRFYRDSGSVLASPLSIVGSPTAANPVLIETGVHGLFTGNSVRIEDSAMTELNGRDFTITILSTIKFELQFEDGTGRSTGTGGTVTPQYQIDDLDGWSRSLMTLGMSRMAT